MGILFLPKPWMFEVLEYWISGTIYPAHQNIQIPSDYELTKGRKTYAKTIGGAYYAARLPVLKRLNEWGRQAAAIIFLEVHPEWLPLGVWRVREICRRALSTTPAKFENLDEAIAEASKHLLIARLWVWQLNQACVLPRLTGSAICNYSSRSAWIAKSRPDGPKPVEFSLLSRRIWRSGGSR